MLHELETQGLQNETIVVFIGDHGWQLGDLGEFGKKTNFERATRTPLIIRDPTQRARGGTRNGGGGGNGGISVSSVPPPAATTAALVEFVDIMPTIIALAEGDDAVPPVCSVVSTNTALCTEGRSLRSIIDDPSGGEGGRHDDTRTAVFMQYAACMHDEGVWHDACAAASEPSVMGYAIRTRRWRYVEWVHFDRTATPGKPLWDLGCLGSELYDHTVDDSVENAAEAANLVAHPAHAATVAQLSAQLRRGWRGAGEEEGGIKG